MNRNAKKLTTLNRKLDAARNKYEAAQEAIRIEFQNQTGIKVHYNDFADDGFALSEDGMDNLMPLGSIIEIINEKGCFTKEDFFYSV